MLIRVRAALVVAFVLARPAAAQNHDYAPLILRLPSSARYLAMGNSAVGSRDDDVLFYNPAQLVIARGTSISGEQYGADARGAAMSSVSRFNGGGIAIGAEMVNGFAPAGDYPLTRGSLVDHGFSNGFANATSLNITAGIAQVYKSLRVGVAAKYVEDDVNGFRLGRGLADVGLSKDLFRGYTFGLALQNIGEHSTVYGNSVDLPTRLSFGATGTRQAGPFDLVTTGDVSALRGGFVVPAGGAELGYSWLDGYDIALRAGARRPGVGEGPITAGAGLTIDRLSVDYAIEMLDHSRVAHRIGLRIR